MKNFTFLKLLMLFFLFLLTGGDYAFAQQRVVEGQVTDETTGEPMPGVNIMVKGTSEGTVTDINGDFTISVRNDNAVLVFSFIGFEVQEVPVQGRAKINISLAPDVQQLSEVVVVGYGSIQKKDLTGAVSSIGAEDVVARGTTSPIAALQGLVPGVNITASSGLPGAATNINIRGINSLGTDGSPLFVVDGVMTDNIDFLNPMDIERIDILKDASSTAIYGSRGSNGVVIVTTKSGATKGRMGFSYQGFVGVKVLSNMPDFHNAEEGILWTQNRHISKQLYRGKTVEPHPDGYPLGFPGPGRDDYAYWKDVFENERYFNWVDEILKPAIQSNHFISASGATDKVSYMIGVGYQGDNGNIEGQEFHKYNFKGSLNAEVTDQWSMGTNINLAYTNRELRSRNAMRQLFRMPLWAPAYDTLGEVVNIPLKGMSGNTSPLAELHGNKYNDQDYYLISNFYVQFKPVDWMSLRSTFSPNIRFNRHGEYWDPAATKSRGGGLMSVNQDFGYIWDNQLHLNKEVGDHNFAYDFIYSMQMDRAEYLFGFGWDLPFNSEFYNLNSAKYLNTASNFTKSTLMSFTNRLNYSFKGKYLFTGTIRWDGSSVLAEGNKWAYFPSAAIGWNLSEEDFISDVKAIDNLKLRLSYGFSGNNNIGPYTTNFFVDQQTYYDWNGSVAHGFRPDDISNKALTWERTREWNLGLDYSLFSNRVSGEINLYDRRSLDLIMERLLAIPTGWGSTIDNVGSVSNRGVEVLLRTINVRTENFSWETSFTFSTNENKIVDLYGKKEDDVPNRWFIGQPVNVVYALEYDGVWQPHELTEENMQELEGTAKVVDQNNDGVIDIDNDMVVLGSPLPSWTAGFQTTFRYKGWDLSANLYTKQGVFIYSPFHELYTDMNTKQILDIDYYMRENPVTEANNTNAYPQPAYAGQYYGEDAEDYGFPGFNKDASFVRLQNVNLGYTMNSDFLRRIGMQEVRLYVNALNPYVWTEYEGFDPEWGSASMSSNSNSFSTYQIGTNIRF